MPDSKVTIIMQNYDLDIQEQMNAFVTFISVLANSAE